MMLHPKKQKTPSTCSGPTGSRASRNPHLKKFRILRASKIEENEDPQSTSRFSLRQIASRANRGVQKKILKLIILILGKQQKQNKFRHAQAVKHTSSVDRRVATTRAAAARHPTARDRTLFSSLRSTKRKPHHEGCCARLCEGQPLASQTHQCDGLPCRGSPGKDRGQALRSRPA